METKGGRMNKRTSALQFGRKTAQKIVERDQDCIFCQMGYCVKQCGLDTSIKDIMHIVPKSQGGLGIEQNGVLGCRYHHGLLDNGNKGLREEMMDIIEQYMRQQYPGWTREGLVYDKYRQAR